MLISLCINQFAIVSHLELDFRTGMTAFTGETGAGKSIMIDALMLTLGERTDISVIRPGSKQCDISASFKIDKNSPPATWLKNHDIEHDNHEIILRRVILIEGRSKSYINGKPFPLQKMKELGEMLVDIHGQHQHQSLLQHETHLHALDQYAKNHDLLKEIHDIYLKAETIRLKLESGVSKNSQKVSLLEFQIEELQNLELKEGEQSLLDTEHNLLCNAKAYMEQSSKIIELLDADDSNNILKTLHQILQILHNLPNTHTSIINIVDLINNALIQCSEAVDEIKNFSNEIDLDPQKLSEVESRISILHQMARKYQVEVAKLPQHLKFLENELFLLKKEEQDSIKLQNDLIVLKQQYEKLALELRSRRIKSAKKLASEISQTIKKLGMPEGFIEIELTPLTKMTPSGLDKVEYKVCTNPGMALASLEKIASGGELSRISLAIHMITAIRGATPTLIFDEVDVGIGGATASLVGQLLRSLAQRLQVLCVTHQAQVASCAHNHVVVTKNTKNNETFAAINVLNEIDKIEEIARMLGGLTITEQTRCNAKELLKEGAY